MLPTEAAGMIRIMSSSPHLPPLIATVWSQKLKGRHLTLTAGHWDWQLGRLGRDAANSAQHVATTLQSSDKLFMKRHRDVSCDYDVTRWPGDSSSVTRWHNPGNLYIFSVWKKQFLGQGVFVWLANSEAISEGQLFVIKLIPGSPTWPLS